ncbi:hypothetical protein C1752_01029 [Acaryochloris thomasi RCC1774]|uniref:Uncharacterized protein n=1 Tax=Acaryochloris thomasi RCC1774 TaxID=1764569 RepID=A0A2W1K577_9CYAN|nr:hypothetical protein [Acaryochloris thomasi]PZD74907.1 hypothetical protein C1752_01029 [Acaryochloris thomasi RCC1774]
MHNQRIFRTSKQLAKKFQNHSIQLPSDKVEGLLYQLCVELGFCLSSKVNKRLAYSPPKNPQRFAEVVMKADGVSPWNSELYDKVFSRVYKVFLTELPDDC